MSLTTSISSVLLILGLISCSFRHDPRCIGTYTPDRYLVGYYIKGEKPKGWYRKYRQVVREFNTCGFYHRQYEYGSNDFKVEFKRDTFDFRIMEQFEPRNGFWIYERGGEPNDFGFDEADSVLKYGFNYFK